MRPHRGRFAVVWHPSQLAAPSSSPRGPAGPLAMRVLTKSWQHMWSRWLAFEGHSNAHGPPWRWLVQHGGSPPSSLPFQLADLASSAFNLSAKLLLMSSSSQSCSHKQEFAGSSLDSSHSVERRRVVSRATHQWHLQTCDYECRRGSHLRPRIPQTRPHSRCFEGQPAPSLLGWPSPAKATAPGLSSSPGLRSIA